MLFKDEEEGGRRKEEGADFIKRPPCHKINPTENEGGRSRNGDRDALHCTRTETLENGAAGDGVIASRCVVVVVCNLITASRDTRHGKPPAFSCSPFLRCRFYRLIEYFCPPLGTAAEKKEREAGQKSSLLPPSTYSSSSFYGAPFGFYYYTIKRFSSICFQTLRR